MFGPKTFSEARIFFPAKGGQAFAGLVMRLRQVAVGGGWL